MKITKRSLRKHHAYQRRKKIYLFLGASTILIGLLHVATGFPFLFFDNDDGTGNAGSANNHNNNNNNNNSNRNRNRNRNSSGNNNKNKNESPIQRLISARQQSRQLKFYQQQQIEDCKNFPVLVHKQNQDEDDKWETIEHPVSSYLHWDQNILPEEADTIPRNFLKVPHMYATKEMREYLGNYGERLMTKDQAQSIGSYVMLDRNTWKRVPEACSEIHTTEVENTDLLDDADDDASAAAAAAAGEEAKAKAKANDSPYIKVETINVMLASFRDGTMCKNTLKGLFRRAKFPERVRVTIVDQVLPNPDEEGSDDEDDGNTNNNQNNNNNNNNKGHEKYYDEESDTPCITPFYPCDEDPTQVLCEYASQIDTLPFNAFESSGPVTSRHLAYRMYRGEYFVLQADSHVEFTFQWDQDIIDQWKSAKNEMGIMSVYPDHAFFVDPKTGSRTARCRAIMCSTSFEDSQDFGMHLRHDQEPCTELAFKDRRLQLQAYWGAGFSFARGHFAINVPYDQYLPHIFQGEESNIGIRAFTYGYDTYAPSGPIVYHYYVAKSDVERKQYHQTKKEKVPLRFWELPSYDVEVAFQAMQRLNTIIELQTNDNGGHVFPKEMKEYGTGQVRSVDRYYDTFGYHRDTKTMEPNMCMFVITQAMNKQFIPALRPDTMGIDYSHDNLKNFVFKDRWPCPRYYWNEGICPNSTDYSEEGEEWVSSYDDVSGAVAEALSED
ncbi:unnamed protein product [Cylindrotheca closterium]|uniref:Uncharacterized protein n=1 Tax=Cylindrotheca closterium TaxID=2856 RepID=A0AAD2FFV6_9STRA|nr:unnamed protein product [Cylindrotheca closterium]